jgi:hypothetical protein
MDVNAELKVYEEALQFYNGAEYLFYKRIAERCNLSTERRLERLKNLDEKCNFVAASQNVTVATTVARYERALERHKPDMYAEHMAMQFEGDTENDKLWDRLKKLVFINQQHGFPELRTSFDERLYFQMQMSEDMKKWRAAIAASDAQFEAFMASCALHP